MKKTLATAAALATVMAALASPAFAASRHHAMDTQDNAGSYAQAPSYGRQSDVVVFGNKVVGEDPDPSIRTQLLHDPNPSEY